MQFEWDRDKAKKNLRRHKVSSEEALTALYDPKKINDELRSEYDFNYSTAVRGKYYRRILEEGANVVMLEPDVAEVFVDSAAVNDALRSLLESRRKTDRTAKHSDGRTEGPR